MRPRRIEIEIDRLVVHDVHFEPKAFEATLARELATRLAGRASFQREPRQVRTSEDVGLTVAASLYQELSG